MSLEKNSVFHAFHLFVFAAKKEMKANEIFQNKNSWVIWHYVMETDLYLSYVGIPYRDKVGARVVCGIRSFQVGFGVLLGQKTY